MKKYIEMDYVEEIVIKGVFGSYHDGLFNACDVVSALIEYSFLSLDEEEEKLHDFTLRTCALLTEQQEHLYRLTNFSKSARAAYDAMERTIYLEGENDLPILEKYYRELL